MRPRANIAIFRLGISLLTALPIACFDAHQAISQTDDISQLPAAADNLADPANGVLALQKLEIKQDETATNFNQLPDFAENNPLDNQADRCSTINETGCDAHPEPERPNLVNSEPIFPNQLHSNVLAQNPQNTPPNLPPPPTQPDPNRDRFLQPAPQPSPEPPQIPQPVAPERPSPVPLPLPNQVIQVQKIQVVGSTILSQDEINALVKPLEGRSTTLEQLKQIADKITEIYLNRGYITSRAVLPPQTITAGVVKIQVIEGKLTRIEVEGAKRLHPSYIRSRIRLGARMPLSTASLENQLRLLRVDPLFDNVEASLRAGDNEGESILIVRVTEANPFQSSFSIDNYSPPSVGSERLGVSLRHRNLTGNGDELAGAYYRSLGDSDVFDFSYRLPLNAMNGTLQLRAAPNRNSIVQEPFDAFDISGKSHLFEVSYRQPLRRTPIEEFALSAGLTYQKGRTFVAGVPTPFGSGPDSNGVTTTTAIKLGQDYIRRDPQGAWALRSQFTIGTSLFDATQNEGSVPDGQFLSWLGQVQRVQRLNDKHLLILQSDLQLSANSLLPSQQFVIGGGQSLRGYRQNVRSGDNGFRLSIEDRITLQRDASGNPKLQLAPFLDAGTVWNAPNNPNKLTNQTFLAGMGLGVIWEPIRRVNLRVDYAFPLVRITDKGNNLQDNGIYFNIIYTP
ncbi:MULTISPECIES: ShlB/FhaC/HecB family hemolysin secretion/activation protein [unclassified Microcoleus]|uniref:ShlB/FhaC/HecB family hemolysin secretion/activation protein n=1 Tax=unclassified Microcoleus TaxID=2642155 RepID=UPI001D64FC85|nr:MULTISPECIES: ShlB/FhaC/HecB family hemolysin secretion/activation protein [unclassified Microcoleus]MCC3442451.1 ShlB/FhaC/HecB family hemolysin secretion/activation protein [Microcoleus sp. PH2017_03_ELD_O_A]MCC3502119.1 ShlB/FhaC/HecB family hemolysin secretion/activation protein [Microcoleus sp. PH2017_19_SFW_U_A]MCC3435376.1 ShlB/FhaC/HecB family hemolysin secretion/activation protein [Microcoleus sp. PH2017_05_CCC_O_A]MCC3521987.1 ShlB/FhaC/HecB family hemolysin secretion/activation pr